MKNTLLSTAVAGSVFLMGLSVSGPAMARDHHQSYSGGHNNGYNSNYGDHSNRNYRRRHNNSGKGAALAFGLVFGTILGSAISNSRRDRVYGNAGHPVEVAPQVRYPQQSTCLQEREYQTRVFVGGRPVNAYGTACLQRDGSWQRGPINLSEAQRHY